MQKLTMMTIKKRTRNQSNCIVEEDENFNVLQEIIQDFCKGRRCTILFEQLMLIYLTMDFGWWSWWWRRLGRKIILKPKIVAKQLQRVAKLCKYQFTMSKVHQVLFIYFLDLICIIFYFWLNMERKIYYCLYFIIIC